MATKRKALSASRRFAVWKRDGFKCTYCQSDATIDKVVLEVDHIIPVVQGGSDEMDNLTTACRPCNSAKGPRGQKRTARITPARCQIAILLDTPDYEELVRIATERGVSRATVVREAIAYGIAKDRRIAQAIDEVA